MRHAYAFIAPFYALFLIFGAFPLVWSFILTLKEWDGLRPMKSVGLRNYILLLRDQRFLDAFGNTALYWAVNIVSILLLSLLMASLLNDRMLGGRHLYRLVLFLPNVTATVAVGLVFKMVFDYNSGLINGILGSVRLPILPWLNSTGLSKIPVMVLSIWRDTPWYMLIMISGLQTISPELYQAATVDGAGHVRKMLHVTIPGLAPVLFFCFLTLTIDSFRIFTEPYIMTGGGPGSSSLSIVQYLYESGFALFKLGYASSIAYVLTLILLVVSAAQVLVFRKRGSVVGGKAA
jgi:ABC-type sugar transport system permease subunit